jgi:hypothetical protein
LTLHSKQYPRSFRYAAILQPEVFTGTNSYILSYLLAQAAALTVLV